MIFLIICRSISAINNTLNLTDQFVLYPKVLHFISKIKGFLLICRAITNILNIYEGMHFDNYRYQNTLHIYIIIRQHYDVSMVVLATYIYLVSSKR